MSQRILRHLLIPLCALLPISTQALTIGTGPLNGVYYPAGGAICRVLNADRALNGDRCTVLSTRGSIANLKALGKGEVQLALVQSDVLHHALHGTGPFSGQGANHELRSLFRLYQESLTLLAAPDSGITTLADIEGKRVYLGNKGAGEQITSQALMAAMGWQPEQFADYQLKSNSEPLEGLCDGSLDAAFVVKGHPSLSIGDLISRCRVRLIPIEGPQIDKLLAQHPYYQRSHIAANLYPGQTAVINNIGMNAELVALASLPDPIVRTVRDTLLARLKQFSRLHPALSKVTPEQLQKQTELPLHMGMMDSPAELSPVSAEPLPPAPGAEPVSPQVTPSEGADTLAARPSDATSISSAAVTTVEPLPEESIEATLEVEPLPETVEPEAGLAPAIAQPTTTPSTPLSTQQPESAKPAGTPQTMMPETSSRPEVRINGGSETIPSDKAALRPPVSGAAATPAHKWTTP